jgi:hypothetical protein
MIGRSRMCTTGDAHSLESWPSIDQLDEEVAILPFYNNKSVSKEHYNPMPVSCSHTEIMAHKSSFPLFNLRDGAVARQIGC